MNLIMCSDIRISFYCEELSAAQKTILIHRSIGRDLATIASLEGLTIGTVKQYLFDARDKLHANNNEQACWLALFSGQISHFEILTEYSKELESI